MTPDSLAVAEEAVRGFVSAAVTVDPVGVMVALAGLAGAAIGIGSLCVWQAWRRG